MRLKIQVKGRKAGPKNRRWSVWLNGVRIAYAGTRTEALDAAVEVLMGGLARIEILKVED